jgi:addiction module HigA family antidote
LRRLVESDDDRGIGPELRRRVRNILAVLIAAEDMGGVAGPPGWRTAKSAIWIGGLPLMTDAPIKIGMRPPHPGAFIRDEILDELGLSVTRAGEILGVRRATLSDLLNGKASLSAEMALRIEKAFGISMDMLLRMQAWHDGHAMRQREAEIDVRPFKPHAAD